MNKNAGLCNGVYEMKKTIFYIMLLAMLICCCACGKKKKEIKLATKSDADVGTPTDAAEAEPDLEKDEDYLELTVSEQELVKKWLEGESNLSVDEENSNMEMNEDEDEATKIMLNDRIRSLNGGCDYAVTGLIYLNGQVMYVLELK